jgi:hypothetical protein
MSEVKDKFYELFAPKLLAEGFTFKKSAGKFVRQENGLDFVIQFRWDGRGGTSIIHAIEYALVEPKIEKDILNLTGSKGLGSHLWGIFYFMENNKMVIPVMYSQKTLDLANDMNFKALAQIPFEEKYPLPNILNCVNKVESLCLDHIIPFFEQNNAPNKVYQTLCKKLEECEKLEDFSFYQILQLKVYAKKLGQPEPDRLKGYTYYLEQYKAHLIGNPSLDFDTLEERLAKYVLK